MSEPTVTTDVMDLQLADGRKLGDIAKHYPELARRHTLAGAMFGWLTRRENFLSTILISQATLSLRRRGKSWRVQASIPGQKQLDLGVSAESPDDARWAAELVAKQVGCKVSAQGA